MHLWLWVFLFLLFGCFNRADVVNNSQTAETEDPAVVWERGLREQALRIIEAMDDRQLAGQVIISGIEGRRQLSAEMTDLLTEIPVGGIMLFRYNLDADDIAIRGLIDENAALIGMVNTVALDADDETENVSVFPFVGLDHEGGMVDRFRRETTHLPPAAFYWELAQSAGRQQAITQVNTDSFRAAEIINCLGINLNFAPVAEHLNDDNRIFLESQRRSYGPDPEFTAEASAAFIMGMEQAGILCTVKHFPGSAGADPHYHPSVLHGDHDALKNLASPFAALIQGGHARAIMIAHSSVPALDSENIASLSSKIMEGWLRRDLGFEGIIISDDFSMAAAGGRRSGFAPESAAVLSIAAGSDMVLVWPHDLRRTHEAILTAVAATLPRQRLQEAAGRILFEKMRMGLVVTE